LELRSLPKLLDVPDKILPVIEQFDDKRYFLLEGGRGGGKSQSIARFVLYLAEKYNIRVVCGRETQNSINESVYSLFTDLIRTYNLNFEVLSQKITSRPTGSTINFRGFREQGAFNIQGMEGVDIVWIDEAQALTKQTLDVLIPTIRKDNAKVFFTMNRHLYNDPAYANFYQRDDCLHININFDDNPFCTTALKKESEECKKLNEKDYQHIWMGQPLDQSEDALFSLSELLDSKNNPHIMSPGYGLRVAGFDIARYGDDKCAVVILQQMGALHWEEIYVDEWDHRDLNYTTGRILMTTNEYKVDFAAIDEDGMGSGPFDTLTKGRQLDYFIGFRNPVIGYQDNKSFCNPRTINAYKLKDLLLKRHICIKDSRVIEELQTLKYTFDHNQRRILVSKEKMKKDGFKSPNLADAIIMAVSLIGTVKAKQEQVYAPQRKNYAEEDSLFKIAGIP
jgi:phage terminase large subunit